MTHRLAWVLYAVVASTGLLHGACAPSSGVVRGGLETMSREERLKTFESTARALDGKPEFVDELYAVARRHPPMFNRILANTTRDLAEPELAHETMVLLLRMR